jgi:hypothetical protein
MCISVISPIGVRCTQTEERLQVVGNTIAEIGISLMHFDAVKIKMLFF